MNDRNPFVWEDPFLLDAELTAEEAEATERDNAMQSEFDEPSA